MNYECPTCNEPNKTYNDFYWKKDCKGKVVPDCKSCISEKRKESKKQKKLDNRFFQF